MPKYPISRYVVPALGVVGFVWAVFYVNVLAKPPAMEPVALGEPAPNPFAQAISGSGVVEASSRNIAIGSHVSGIIGAVYVQPGQDVKAGDPLFALDSRTAEAELAVARAEAADAADLLRRGEGVKQGIAISGDALARRKFAAERTAAQLLAAQVMLDKQTVRAPVDGRVFQVNVAVGEAVNVNAPSSGTPLLVMGTVDPLYVRISLDENDAWRYVAGQPATGAVRGNQQLTFPLKFVRIEPYVVPKKSLTGATSERVDTRVLDVMYEVQPNSDGPDGTKGAVALFPGQQIDVFIAADSKAGSETPRAIVGETVSEKVKE